MAYFEFWDCVDRGRNVIDEWLETQPAGVRAAFVSLFGYLANVPIAQWTPPRTQMLTGPEFRQLREFRVKVERIHYRLVGFHGTDRDQVTLCAGYAHGRGGRAERAEWRRALNRKAQIERGEAGRVISNVL